MHYMYIQVSNQGDQLACFHSGSGQYFLSTHLKGLLKVTFTQLLDANEIDIIFLSL